MFKIRNRSLFILFLVFTGLTGPAALELETAEASLQGSLLRLHNIERRRLGRSNLRLNGLLNSSSARYSRVMRINNHFSHTGPDGSTLASRVTAVGYNFRSTGENLAFGFTNARAVHNAWMRSPGHRRNILRASFTEVGFGRSGTYWTSNFGRPR